VAVEGGQDEEEEMKAKKALLNYALHSLNGDLFPELMELMG
jgi:hypothetical protein